MKKVIAALAAVVVVAGVATGVLVARLSGDHGPKYPEISAYSNGKTVRVGPFQYCEVLNPTKCELFEQQGELRVSERGPVQLSVPPAVARAPWVLLRQYEDSEIVEEFRPNSRLAVSIPTVDPRYGKLAGIGVFLPTLIKVDGEEIPAPHAEWSVRTVWD